MTNLNQDFEWRVDTRGYRLEDEPRRQRLTESPFISTYTPGASGIALPSGLQPRVQDEHLRVVPLGGALRTYRPLREFELLWSYFAFEASVDAEKALSFIRRFGPLTADGNQGGPGERVAFVMQQALAMSRLYAAYMTGNKTHIAVAIQSGIGIGQSPKAQLLAKIIIDQKTGMPDLVFGLPDLLSALWLQFGLVLSAKKAVRSCPQCGSPFFVGPGTGRRLDAQFCSDEHRIRFNSKRRSEE